MDVRRLSRFRLRTLLILVALMAALIVSGRGVVVRHNVEQAALRRLSEGRFAVEAKLECPWWIPTAVNSRLGHVFDRVVLLSFAGRPIDFDRGIVLNPANFRDEHMRQLVHFRKLRCLNLSMTQIGSGSVGELAQLRSLKALDIRGTPLESSAIGEFQRQRPDCLVCDSQPIITVNLYNDETVFIRRERDHLKEVGRLLIEARRGPDLFGYVPKLYISLDDDVAEPWQAAMIAQLRSAARSAGYQSFQVDNSAAGPP